MLTTPTSSNSLLLDWFHSNDYELVEGSFYQRHLSVCQYSVKLPGSKAEVETVELNDPSEEAANAYIDAFKYIASKTPAGKHIFTLGSFIGAGEKVPAAYMRRRAQEILDPINKHFNSSAAIVGFKSNIVTLLGQGMIRLYQLTHPEHKQVLFLEIAVAMRHLQREALKHSKY